MPERVSIGKYFRSLCTAHAGIVIFLHFCTGGITGLIDIIFHLLIVDMCRIFILLAVVWKRAVWCETFTPVERIIVCPCIRIPRMVMQITLIAAHDSHTIGYDHTHCHRLTAKVHRVRIVYLFRKDRQCVFIISNTGKRNRQESA